MPTATLLELNRLNIGGAEMYHRGVEQEVTVATALRLAQDPRFKVKGLTTRDLVEHQEAQSRPRGKDLYDEIRTAADDLDVDNDDNFDRSGRPSVSALSAALGYPITAEERDAALAQKGATAPVAEGELLDSASAPPAPPPSGRKPIKVPQVHVPAKPAEPSVAMGG
jgi:hypothetical protein